MKRFFPSSVMLTPFVVKYYHEPEEDDNNADDEREESDRLALHQECTNEPN